MYNLAPRSEAGNPNPCPPVRIPRRHGTWFPNKLLWKIPVDRSRAITSVAISPDRNTVVSVTEYGEAELYNAGNSVHDEIGREAAGQFAGTLGSTMSFSSKGERQRAQRTGCGKHMRWVFQYIRDTARFEESHGKIKVTVEEEEERGTETNEEREEEEEWI
ncbi:hypothetical protein HYPSUDRAFT_55115 [Hypholoma sublateritium FD-334 SS-4]|uniref:Uncharacterized protein n=1 Tax=Hypholoma sublateritium (strain FD-334 SS-4) TaxID=945553 RepID=A0A0D2PPZ8_HYPSF|nr:hypothetical protein HYPSUDRAFT_55115 [Hypholoma sublateritium FD-334 SS-4]